MKKLALIVILCGLGSSPAAQLAGVGTGLLGSTEDELVKKLGPPDIKRTEYLNSMYLKTTRKPVPPVVKTVDFLWQKVKNKDKSTQDVFMAIGFDAKGVARTIRTEAGWVWTPEGMKAFSNAVASGWRNDKEASAVFAKQTVTGPQLIMSSQMVWQDSGVGVKFLKERPTVEMLGGQRTGQGRIIAVSDDGRVYWACNVSFDSRAPNPWSYGNLELCDAETFWLRAVDELVSLWKVGEPTESVLGPRLPDKYAPNPKKPNLKDHFTATSYRLTAAVVAMVRNPSVDLKQARVPVMILRDWPDPKAMNALIEILKKGPPPVRGRAAELLAFFPDSAAVEALIDALRAPVPAAAVALKEIAGVNQGEDADAWQQWWKDNHKTVQARFDAQMQEATGDLRVFESGGKHYHLAECPDLARSQAAVSLLKSARKHYTPCQKCKPPK